MLRAVVLRLKWAAFWLIDLTAVLEYLAHGRRPRHGLAILCYHRVAAALPRWPPHDPYNVRPTRLAEQLQALVGAPDIEVVGAMKVAGWMQDGRVPTGSHVLLTFDDGYANVLGAARALRDRGLTAAFFVVSDAIGTPLAGWSAYDRWAQRQPGASDTWYRPLTEGECRELLALGMDVQPHGHTHRSLGRLPAPEVDEEVLASRDFVGDRLGQPTWGFAYPYGSTRLGDVGRSVELAIERAGFAFGLSTDAGSNPPATAVARRFRLRRIPVHDHDRGLAFRAKAAGYAGLLPLAKSGVQRVVGRARQVPGAVRP